MGSTEAISTIDYRLSTIDYRLSTIDYRLSTIDYRLSIIDYEEGSTMTGKVCPLLYGLGLAAYGAAQGRLDMPDGWGECTGPVCAWYDASAGRCAVLGASLNNR